MTWCAKSICVLLALIWLPVTAHCSLERCFQLAFLACDTSEAPGHHQEKACDADACIVLESGLYKLEDQPPVPQPALLAAFLHAPELRAPADDAANPQLGTPAPDRVPPDLPQSWRFAWRTALPVRAPARNA